MIKVSVDSQDFMPNWNILMDGVNAGDIKNAVSILGWGRSTRDGNGNPLQFCFLENPMDRGPWQATVIGLKSQTQLRQISTSTRDRDLRESIPRKVDCGFQSVCPHQRKLINLTTWTTALSNSANYEPCCVAPPETDGSWWRGMTKRGPLENGMVNHFSNSCLENPINSMKRQNDRTLKDELKSAGAQYTTGDQWRNNSRKNKETEPKQNSIQLWI